MFRVGVLELNKFQLQKSTGMSSAACPACTTLAICYLIDSKELNLCVCLQ